jgi:metallo-beta-lactamase family protein
VKLQFFGAVRSVTGSMHMIHAGKERVLLECGLYQGKRREAEQKNRNLPFDPKKVTGCVLSHAHIDHSGNLPNLVKNGYAGRIHATDATVDLAKVMLMDSAFLQQKDADYLNEKRDRRDDGPPVEPIYTKQDAEETNRRFEPVKYKEWFDAAPGVRAAFYDAGHILGSAVTVYELEEGGRKVRVAFTGDLGRPAAPILRDPQRIPEVDYLITESTYGNRVHEGISRMKERLCEVVSATVKRGGRVLIPAFSVGRTQNIVYYLSQLYHEGALPQVPVFVDSPLSVEATKAYKAHPECYDAETQELMARGDDVFGFNMLKYCRTQEESKELNTRREPCVVISASGMCEGGRILHHLKQSVPRQQDSILIVGFMAENTLGRRLVEKERTVRIYGKEYDLRARVETMNGFSAHADKDELSTYIKLVPGLKKVFVVHGEEEASLSLAAYIETKLKLQAHVPSPGEAVEL